MFRAFILPMLLMGLVGGPMLYSHHQRRTAVLDNVPMDTGTTQAPWQAASYRFDASNNNPGMPSTATQPGQLYRPTTPPTSFPQPVRTNGVNSTNVQTGQAPIARPVVPTSNTFPTRPVRTAPTTFATTDNRAWAQPGMEPDFAKAQTMVFPGDANGPDLSAQPMSFIPTIDLSSLFRFDVSKQSITSRWDRVSTCPADQGLHGMRVALVTGTNSWDLHGSLTYYFDANHRVQRITYRGWTGDATRLIQTLNQQHQLRPQPTHWAGLYLSKRSGLLMKHPAVIDKNNPVQQLALILEINNPRGKTPLSDDFQSLLPAAMATQ